MASQYNNFRKTQHFVRRCYTMHSLVCFTEEEQILLDRKSINKVFIIHVIVEKHELFRNVAVKKLKTPVPYI